MVYYDATNLAADQDRTLQARLCSFAPDLPWEVTNRAAVHLWFERHFGHPVEPLSSLQHAVATWPEYATAVALTLRDDDQIDVIAPHGLEDLFAMVVRRNPTRVSVETYHERVRQKNYTERWPLVTVLPA